VEDELDLEELIFKIVRDRAVSFDELRDELEAWGVYIDGRVLRKVVAELVRRGVLCKTPSAERRKLLLHACQPRRNT